MSPVNSKGEEENGMGQRIAYSPVYLEAHAYVKSGAAPGLEGKGVPQHLDGA